MTTTTVIVGLLLGLSGWRCAEARDILPPGPVDASVGKNVTLRTLLVEPVYTFIIWNFNDGREQIHVATVGPAGLKVNTPYLGRVSVDAQSGALHLSSLTTADNGDFSVSVVSAEGDTETAEIRLRVLEPVSGVTLSANLAEAVEHNSTVVLTCAAKGSFLNFTWLNGTAPFVPGPRLAIVEGEATSQLTITGVLRTDLMRPISCSAANKLQTEKSAPFSLPVHYGPDEVTITASDPAAFVRAGSDFNLTCATRSSPPATVTWYQNQTLMDATGPVLPLQAVQQRPLWQQMSQYTCRAANSKTERMVASRAVSFAVMAGVGRANERSGRGRRALGRQQLGKPQLPGGGGPGQQPDVAEGRPAAGGAGGRRRPRDGGARRHLAQLGAAAQGRQRPLRVPPGQPRQRGEGGLPDGRQLRSRGGERERAERRGGARRRHPQLLGRLRAARQLHLEVQRDADRRQDGHLRHRPGRLQEHGRLHVPGAQRRHWEERRLHAQPVRQRGGRAGRRPVGRRHRGNHHRHPGCFGPGHRHGRVLQAESSPSRQAARQHSSLGGVTVLVNLVHTAGDSSSNIGPGGFPMSAGRKNKE